MPLLKSQQRFFTSAKDNIDGNTENNNHNRLDTNANRHEGQLNQELALIVNTSLISKRNWQKQIHQKNLPT
jgi:hypothetical protein